MSSPGSKTAPAISSQQLTGDARQPEPDLQISDTSNKKEAIGAEELLRLRHFLALLDRWDKEQKP
jgi:hypothetical protein